MTKDPIKLIHSKIVNAMSIGERTPCYFFAVDGEVFYYGWDGVVLHKGKLTEKSSKYRLKAGEIYIVR